MADRTVVVRLVAQVTGYTAGIAQADAATKKFSESAVASTARQRAALSTLGTAAITAGAGILAGFAVAAKAAMNFETAMAGVSTTVKASPAQFAALTSGIRKLATEIPVTRESLAGVVEEAGKLGVATPNLLSFAKSMEQVGASTDINAQDAARGLTQLATATHLPITEVPRLGNVLVALGNDSKASESKILTSAQSIAGAGHLIGLSTPQILAFGTAVAGLGSTGQAGLGITRLFTGISQAVSEGGDKLTQFAQIAGMTTDAFSNEFKTNAGAAILAFLTGLDQIRAHGGNALDALNQLSLGGSRGARIIAGLAAEHGQLAHSLGLSSSASDRNNAAQVEAAKRWATTSNQLKLLVNQLTDAAVSIGNSLLPVLKAAATDIGPLLKGVDELASAFGRLPSPVRDGIVGLGLLAGAGLVAVGTLAKIAGGVMKLREAYILLKGSEEAAAAAQIGGEAAGGVGAAAGGAGLLAGAGTAGLVAASVAVAAGPIIAGQGANSLSKLRDDLKAIGPAAAEAKTQLAGMVAAYEKALGNRDLFHMGPLKMQIDAVAGSVDNAKRIIASTGSSTSAAGADFGFAAARAAVMAASTREASGAMAGAASASSALAGELRLIGASSLASIGGVQGLISALAGLQGLQIGVSVAQDSVFSSIDSALQTSGGGGGGGGGAAKTMADTLAAARKIPDAMRAVQDSQSAVISQAFTLRDAYRGVAQATDQVRRAQQDLADANQAEKTAATGVAAAEKHLQEVLHGVSSGSAAGVAGRRTRTDTGLSLQEAQLGLRTAKIGVTSADKGVAEAAAEFGKGTKPYEDAVAAREQANIDLIRAQEAVSDATKAHNKAEKDLSDTLHGAPAGSEKVKQATQALKDARHTLRDATNAQIDAEANLVDAHENVKKATESLRVAQISMNRTWEDAQRAQQDLTAAIHDGSAAMGGAGGSAQKMKGQLDQAKQSVLDTATNFANLASKTRGSVKWTEAYLKELTAAKTYADQHYGPNNPISRWLDSVIPKYQALLDLLLKSDQKFQDIVVHSPRVIGGQTVQGPIGVRAKGGPVAAGESYLVGEHGPEIVKFSAPGTVFSHAESMSMWGNAKAVSPTPQIDYGRLAAMMSRGGRDAPLIGQLFALDAQDAFRQAQRVQDREHAVALMT